MCTKEMSGRYAAHSVIYAGFSMQSIDRIEVKRTVVESRQAGSICCGSWYMRGVLSVSSRWPASCTDAQTYAQTPYSRCSAREETEWW